MDRIECPDCKTSYTLERCGLAVPKDPTAWVRATVVCSVCKRQIEVTLHTVVTVHVDQTVVPRPRWKPWLSDQTVVTTRSESTPVIEVK